ncbi:MAG TPA: PEGA domain-containing protein [Planctomycetes bacterium]|nr:PEGA domain-containing protein [Planctomycetota bacterium]
MPASPPFSSLPIPDLRAVPAFLGLLLFLLPSCKGPTWTIESTPPRAEVFLDGRKIGATPAEVEGVYPGTRELLLTAPGREARTFLLDVRPGPPGWIFPLDFPLDMGLALFTSRDRVLDLTLPSAQKREVPEPGREEIKAMTDRALELSRKRVDWR